MLHCQYFLSAQDDICMSYPIANMVFATKVDAFKRSLLLDCLVEAVNRSAACLEVNSVRIDVHRSNQRLERTSLNSQSVANFKTLIQYSNPFMVNFGEAVPNLTRGVTIYGPHPIDKRTYRGYKT